MELIRHLLAHWRARLLCVRAVSASSTDGWLWRLRERVLTFLISRYSDPAAAEAEQARIAAVPRAPVRTFCLVEPQDSPPRPAHRLTSLMRSIHAENERARNRLRWRFF